VDREIEVADGNAIGPPHDLKPPSQHASASGLLESNAQSDEAPAGGYSGSGRGRGGIAVDDRFHLIYGKFTQHQPLRFDLLRADPTRVGATAHPVMLRDAVIWHSHCPWVVTEPECSPRSDA